MERGSTSSPLIIEKIMMGLSNMRHKGRVRTRFISDIVFVFFVIIFGELIRVRNLTLRLKQESNPGLTRRNETPSDCPSDPTSAKGQPISPYTIGSDPRLQRFVRGSDLG